MSALRPLLRPRVLGFAALTLADVWLTFVHPHAAPPSDFRVGLMLPAGLAALWLGAWLSQRGRGAPAPGCEGLARPRRVAPLHLAGGILGAIAGTALCASGLPLAGFLIWLLGLGLAAGACPPPAPRRQSAHPRWVPWAMVALALISFGLRQWGLREMPGAVWVDEAEHFKNIFRRPTGAAADPFGLTAHIHVGWTYTSNLYLYTDALLVHWFGLRFEAMKLGSTLPSALAPAAVFLLGLALRRAWMGLLAAVLVATAPWHLIIGRWGHYHVLCAALQILAMALLARGLLRAADHRSWMLAGLTLGLCFHAYLLAPAAVLIALLSAIAAAGAQRRLRGRVIRGLPLLFLGLALTAGPLFATLWREPEKLGERIAQVSVLEAVREQGPWPLLRNTALTAGMLLVRGDANPRHNIAPPEGDWWKAGSWPPAQINPLWSVTLVTAVIFAVRRRREPIPLILVIWLLGGLLPSILSVPAEVPHAYRAQLAVAPAALLVAWVLGLSRPVGLRRGISLTTTALIAGWGLFQFFGEHWQRPASVHAVWGGVDTRLALALRDFDTPEDRAQTALYLENSLDCALIDLLLHTAGYASIERFDITARPWPITRAPHALLAVPAHAHGLAMHATGRSGVRLRDRFGRLESAFFPFNSRQLSADPLAGLRGWLWRFTLADDSIAELPAAWPSPTLMRSATHIEAEGLWWRESDAPLRLRVDTNCPFRLTLAVASPRGEASWTWQADRAPSGPIIYPEPVYPQPGPNQISLVIETEGVAEPRFDLAWIDPATDDVEPIAPEHMLHTPPGEDLGGDAPLP